MKILNEKKLRKNIDESVKKSLEQQTVGGAEIIVNQGGEKVFHEVYGNKNESEKLTFDGLYRIASMTKPITAAAVLKEVERGNIDLDADVSHYLSEYEYSHFDVAALEDGKTVIKGKNTKRIKVFHLLSHTSGIGSDWLGVKAMESMTDEEKKDLDSVVEYYSKQPLAFEPFTWERYSPTASFDVAAKIVEKTSSKSFDTYLKENIFDPLNMKDTTFVPTQSQWDRTVGMFNRDENGRGFFCDYTKECVFENIPLTYKCAGGGLLSSAEDYSRFAEMLLNYGVGIGGSRVLDENLVRKMSSPLVPDSVMKQDYHRWGLGVRVIISKKYPLPVGSFGWSGAYGTHFWVDPVNNITAVYMKNSLYDGGSGSVTSYIFEKDVMRSF